MSIGVMIFFRLYSFHLHFSSGRINETGLPRSVADRAMRLNTDKLLARFFSMKAAPLARSFLDMRRGFAIVVDLS